MHRTPLHGGRGWIAARQGESHATNAGTRRCRLDAAEQDSAASRPKRCGQSRTSDSPVPGEGEVGCVFDEISILVEPTERSAMDGRAG